MKKSRVKKLAFLLILSPLTLGGIVGCESNPGPAPVEQKVSVIKVKDDITNGKVLTSLTGTTAVNTEVTIIAIPDEGYEVDQYFLNDKALDSDTFMTIEGDNVVAATFKKIPEVTKFGSVEVITEDVTNGTVVATLEDGTEITTDNRRQPVGTKVVLRFTPVNECYEIKEVKLNDTALELKDGACEFTVIEGKNFISATFGLSHPGEGLIRLVGEVLNATYTISNLDEYVAVDSDVTVTVTPETNFTVKSVTVNGVVVGESETPNTFVFKALEGLNEVEISVVSIATGISIVVPEGWFENENTYNTTYYVEVGQEFKLDVKFEPEGSYDDLVWSLGYDFEKEYIELSEDGTIKILKAYDSAISVKVALKSDSWTYDTINLLPVSTNEYSVAKLRSNFKADKVLETTDVSKSTIKVESKGSSDEKAVSTTYDFETFSDGHSITKVTDDKGMNSYFYRTITNNMFYAVHRDSSGDKAVEEPIKVTEDNKTELEANLNTFGGVEFIESDYGTKYAGALDYVYETIFGEYSIYDETDDEERAKIYEGSTVTESVEGYELSTSYTYEDFLSDAYKVEITLVLNYDYYYDRISSVTYERKDYELESLDSEVTDATPYSLDKIEVSLTYGEKGEDTSGLFDLNDYLYTDFKPIIYTDRDNITSSTLSPNSDGKVELTVDNTYYVDVTDVAPTTGLDELNKVTVESSDTDVTGYLSSTSYNAKYYFTADSAGEATLTFTVGTVVKTIDVVVSFAPVESVEFSEDTIDAAFVGEKLDLDATVLPEKGVSSDEVLFTIKEGTNTCEAEIVEEQGLFSSSFYVTASKAGSVTIVATSVADPTKFAEKTFTFKDVPSVLSDLSGKTYTASWTDFGYMDTVYGDYEIAFGEGGTTATIKYSLRTVPDSWYSDDPETTTIANYSATVTQEGMSLVLSNLVDLGESDILPEDLPSINLTINTDLKLTGLTLDVNGETEDLTEKIDVLADLKGRTFKAEDDPDILTILFKDITDGKLTCSIVYSTGYSVVTTSEFTADVELEGSKLVLTNIVAVTEGANPDELPATEFSYKVVGGTVESLSYEGSWWDITMDEVK